MDTITGVSLVAGERAVASGKSFRAINPATGGTLPTEFFTASPGDIRHACAAAAESASSSPRPAEKPGGLPSGNRPPVVGQGFGS